ncbi:MAG: propionyl-CoA synthetase, partial [Rhodobacteraceae bacterium]
MTYQQVYDGWKDDPEQFWMEAAKGVTWFKDPSKALFDEGAPIYEWFKDGELNICYNAVDRHVEAGRGDQVAIIYDSPITGNTSKTTYAELQQKVASLGGALQAQGITKGDRVIIYMPMITEAMIAMLACARIGAVHAVVFGGFAANELATRINDVTPKAIIAASCGVEPSGVIAYKPLIDGAVELSDHKPEHVIIFQREQCTADMTSPRDLDWDAIQKGVKPASCVSVGGAEPVYILHTSGTTGQPKGVVRPTGGYAVALNWTMKNIYAMEPGEVFWAASDVGWVVGHSYICYGPLIHGNTTIVFEGKPIGTPDAGTFWRVIEEHKVKSFFTAPTAFRAIKRVDPKGEFVKKYDLSGLRNLFLAGERADPDTIYWA